MHRMLFEKTGTAIWMSHLDTMRVMQRAFRRAGVLLHHSQGYTPHAYVSMLLPLSVGIESRCEIMEYELDTPLQITPAEMNAVLPEGVCVRSVYESTRKPRELALLHARLCLIYDQGLPECGVEALTRLFAADVLSVEKRTKRGMEQTDIRPLLRSVTVTAEDNRLVLDCRVSAQNPALNPMLLLTAIETHLPQYRPDACTCCRLDVLDEQGQPFR